MIIVGQQVRSQPVSGGRSRVLACARCGHPSEHVEHRVVHTATLFFLPVANVREQTVWRCKGCGTRVAEGDGRWLSGAQEGTAIGRVMAAVDSLAEEARPALQRLQQHVGEAVGKALGDAPAGPPEPVDKPATAHSEPVEPRPVTPRKRRL